MHIYIKNLNFFNSLLYDHHQVFLFLHFSCSSMANSKTQHEPLNFLNTMVRYLKLNKNIDKCSLSQLNHLKYKNPTSPSTLTFPKKNSCIQKFTIHKIYIQNSRDLTKNCQILWVIYSKVFRIFLQVHPLEKLK